MPSTYQQLARAWDWRPIWGCPGRSVLRGTSSLSPAELAGEDAAVLRFRVAGARDPVLVVPVAGGGLISYAKPDGEFVHTLGDPAGLRRKLAALGIDLRAALAVAEAQSPTDIAHVRALFVEYQSALGLDLCFQGFEQELLGLPGKYAPPAGTLLLCSARGHAAGCVGLRPLADGASEMKRLYVRPAWRGFGVGRMLAHGVVEAARRQGYALMRLDTLQRMTEAVALYRSMGFVAAAPYCANPEPDALYLELAL
jgi:putative acetyltransferase